MVALDEQFHRKGKSPQCGRRSGGQSARSMRPVVRNTADMLPGRCRRDKCGVIVETCYTDAYGNKLIFTGPGADGVWFTDDDVQSNYGANGIIYCGYRYDAETENDYVRNRYYSPVLGRWITRDPIGISGGINLYGYSGGRAASAADPQGLWEITAGPAGVVAIAQPGDTLGGLAEQVYGRASAWTLLGYQGNPQDLPIGTRIDVSSTPALQAIKAYATDVARANRYLRWGARLRCGWAAAAKANPNKLGEVEMSLAQVMAEASEAAGGANAATGGGINVVALAAPVAIIVNTAEATQSFRSGETGMGVSYTASGIGCAVGILCPPIAIATAVGGALRAAIEISSAEAAKEASEQDRECRCSFYHEEYDFFTNRAARERGAYKNAMHALLRAVRGRR